MIDFVNSSNQLVDMLAKSAREASPMLVDMFAKFFKESYNKHDTGNTAWGVVLKIWYDFITSNREMSK